MKNYLATITMPHVSGIHADADENTWAFTGPDDETAAINDVNDAFHSFYVASATGTETVGWLYAPCVSRSVHPTINLYHITDLTGATPMGPPVATRVLDAALPAPARTDPLPSEVAVCLSFHGDLTGLVERVGATRPANRHRGRIYLGPLNSHVIDVDADTQVAELYVPSRDEIAHAAGTLLAGVFGVTWCVWSRKNAALYPVVGGFVDNAFDIQRRRGERPTNRRIWPS